MKGITVTAETYGAHDDGPDVIAVHVDGREVGAYCIAALTHPLLSFILRSERRGWHHVHGP